MWTIMCAYVCQIVVSFPILGRYRRNSNVKKIWKHDSIGNVLKVETNQWYNIFKIMEIYSLV